MLLGAYSPVAAKPLGTAPDQVPYPTAWVQSLRIFVHILVYSLGVISNTDTDRIEPYPDSLEALMHFISREYHACLHPRCDICPGVQNFPLFLPNLPHRSSRCSLKGTHSSQAPSDILVPKGIHLPISHSHQEAMLCAYISNLCHLK